MVSSSVRSRLGGLRLIGTVRSVIAPPFQRSTSSAWASVWSRCTVMLTSSSRLRSSRLRSLSVVVGADHTPARSSPSARIAVSLAGSGFSVARLRGGRVRPRRRRGLAARCSTRSPGRGRPAGCPGRRRGSGARRGRPRSGPARPGGATAPARRRGRPRAAGRRPGRPAARPAAARPGTPRRPRRRSPAPPTRRCRVPRPSTSWPVPVQ